MTDGKDDAVSGELAKATDAELLEAVGRLEVDALGEVFRRHGAAVFVLAHQLLGARRAEEATHDVFLHVWDHPDELRNKEGNLRSALLNQLRRRHVVSLDQSDRGDDDQPLTDEERAVLELALEGLGYMEAASRLGLPSTVVDNLLRTALSKIYEARVAPTEDFPGAS